MSGRPEISVVVPTYNRLPRLKRVLDSLAAQSLSSDRFEVVVVSDGSSDGTDEYLRQPEPRFSLVAASQPNLGPAAARNHGVELASADLVLFLDDDVIASTGLLRCHLDAHQRLGADHVVIGTMSTPPEFRMSPWVKWEQQMLYKQYDALVAGNWAPSARQFYTGNASLERRHIVAVGGFDTSFRRAEDVEMAYRLADRGLQFAFEPNAVGHHFAERAFASWLGNASEYGRSDVLFARDRKQSWLLPQLRLEFDRRDRLTRIFTDVCLRVPLLERIAIPALKGSVWVATALHIDPVTRVLLSALYNLCYYDGLSGELGSWSSFVEMTGVENATYRGVPT